MVARGSLDEERSSGERKRERLSCASGWVVLSNGYSEIRTTHHRLSSGFGTLIKHIIISYLFQVHNNIFFYNSLFPTYAVL